MTHEVGFSSTVKTHGLEEREACVNGWSVWLLILVQDCIAVPGPM